MVFAFHIKKKDLRDLVSVRFPVLVNKVGIR